MSKPHKHAAIIKAWADGAEIECLDDAGKWVSCLIPDKPLWCENTIYRIKPKEKVVRWQWVSIYTSGIPQLSRYFYSEAEAMNAFKNGVTVIGKAEWTRMEFEA